MVGTKVVGVVGVISGISVAGYESCQGSHLMREDPYADKHQWGHRRTRETTEASRSVIDESRRADTYEGGVPVVRQDVQTTTSNGKRESKTYWGTSRSGLLLKFALRRPAPPRPALPRITTCRGASPFQDVQKSLPKFRLLRLFLMEGESFCSRGTSVGSKRGASALIKRTHRRRIGAGVRWG